MVDQRIGGWAFLLGVVIAIIAGLASGLIDGGLGAASAWVTLALVILGLIIGFLNLNDKETQPFLVAAIALMLVGTANLTMLNNLVLGLGTVIFHMLANVVILVAPAALVVALKSVQKLASRPS